MSDPFPNWRAQLVRDGVYRDMPAITRGKAQSVIYTPQGNFSTGSFSMQLRASPDADTALATFTCTAGAFSGGATPVTISLPAAAQSGIPVDADGDGVETLLYDLIYSPAIGAPYRLVAGYQPITGAVTP